MSEQNQYSYREFEIWSEGYACTGQHANATYHGKAQGRTFQDAILKFASLHSDFAAHLNEKQMTYWGCRLFDNEEDARECFG